MAKQKLGQANYTRRYVYNAHYHFIWVTKYRHQIFTTDERSDEMKQILTNIATDNHIDIQKIEVMPNHVHLILSFPPYLSASEVLKILKGRSAFLFMQKHPEIKQSKSWDGHFWSPSYYFGTIGNMSQETVDKYITNQKYNALGKSSRKRT